MVLAPGKLLLQNFVHFVHTKVAFSVSGPKMICVNFIFLRSAALLYLILHGLKSKYLYALTTYLFTDMNL